MGRAFAAYKAEVESRAFPAEEHCVEMPEEDWRNFLQGLDDSSMK
jgi:hypothetical protein